MKVVLVDDVHAFADRVLPWAAREPVVTNVLATSVEAIRDGHQGGDGALWLTVLDTAGEVAGAAMQTPPFPLFVCPMPAPAARAAATALAGVLPRLTGVVGEAETAAAFARAWQAESGADITAGQHSRLYALGELNPPTGVPGRLRAARPADRDLLIAWTRAFHVEAVPDHPAHDVEATVDQRIAHGTYHLWEVAGRAVSFAGAHRPAAGLSRIGPVYTPPAHRRHGYAGAAVAALSRHAMDAGAAGCILYTDLANPTSNSIYQKIGYRAVCDSRQYGFTYP